MRVFVTGASGFVGREVLRQLFLAGHSVKALVRSRRSADWLEFEGQPLEFCVGSVFQTVVLAAGMKGCDAVIHLVGIISPIGENTFERVHVEGTRNVIQAEEKNGIRRHIQMSAMGTGMGAVSQYHQSKWRAEELVRTSGLDYTIFRPSIIYGPADHFVNLFAGISRFSPVLPVMGSGNGLMQPIAVKDVAACFVGALGEPTSLGQTFELGGNERLSFNQILDTILKVTHRRRFKLHLPMPVARFQARLLESIFPILLRKASPLTCDQLLMLQQDNVGDAGVALRLFNIQPESFENGISHYL